MAIPDRLKNPTPRMLRQFAAGWFLFFLVVAARGWWRGYSGVGIGLGAVALVGPLLLSLSPRALAGLFVGWMWLAFPIGWLVSQISLAIIFYGAFTPLGWCLRLAKRDRLRRFKKSNTTSGWKAKVSPSTPHRYFRPY